MDASPAKREMRAETMRKLGMDVDTAADIDEARSWWRADLYNLVLINMESDMGHRDRFCDDIRGAIPPQQLAFLVGKPAYLSDSPNADVVAIELAAVVLGGEATVAPLDAAAETRQRWGIMEASRRISRRPLARRRPDPCSA